MKNPKVENAFNAMKALGIASATVKPVLKQLLKMYDKNWEFIEAENYRALVDAIFEFEEEKEDKRVEVKRKEPVNCDGSEPPHKKVHWDIEEDEASSTVDSSGKLIFRKEGDIPPLYSSERPNTSYSSVDNKEVELGTCSAMHKEKGHLSSVIISTSGKIKSERASSSSCSKFPINESASLPEDLEKICAGCVVPIRASTSKIHSDLVEGSSTGHMCAKLSQCVDDENIKESASACNFQRSEHKFDIVSLPSGDVKLCCVHALDKATSHVQDMDAVLKLVEEEFLRSHKIVGPPFSLKSLLEDICKRFCELANDCTNQSLVRKTSPEDFSQHILCCSKESAGVPVARKSLEVQNEKDPETETSQAFGNRVKRHPQLYVDDITKGEENVKISLVDERNNRQPPKFFYIPKNLIYQKAIVNISLARISDEDCCPSCSGDCLSSPVPCACARVTNGEFAYTNDGLLKSEFLKACINENKYVYCHDCPVERAKNERKPENCKGHSVKKFIKECWSKCGCSTQCGNRVVQRGISRNLQVYWTTEGKGWGLRTLEDLPEGAFVCEYVGEVVTNTELDERNKQSRGNERHTYPVQLDADWGSESILDDDFALCLDATNYGNIGRFVNHKCHGANLIEIPVEVETADHHYYHLAFFTTQEVKAFEELTWDYGIDFEDEDHPIKAFRCRCGSAYCRYKNRKGSRSKPRASNSNR
ncbi:probable inactive histone-lysine N-methyltransferase SUVR2 isoform X2 [Beta vulgaris subsp. vulgaris]|uniref:probable inactive histone-lysine N-methyltransferase SUVR2 isoform X2 n=1 Tax=Beta vulgaris subsp. vulgaris TaxID=3555 RepID=UPI0020371F9A|nr:probable inactive histone-lysine N-methyltransferase SUVR2 isoform X2 [Beta vulgaris subsp. vulgaris]